MRILVVAWRPAYLPNVGPVLRSLAERGHELHVALEDGSERVPGQLALLDQLVATFPGVSRGLAPVRADRFLPAVRQLRRGLDALRYLEPRNVSSPWVRTHRRERAPARVRRLLGARLLRRPRARGLVRRLLSDLERALPVPSEIAAFLARHRPDVLVVTPLVAPGGSQTDFLRAARASGVPTVAWIYSWDNLTTKGAIHELPDRLTVWNEIQRREAIELHDVPADRVAVTGAQAWDHWFDWRPSTSREEFARRVGLAPDRPWILYVGSSGGGLGPEAPFVERWRAAMRSSGRARLKSAGVLVRPHPYAPRGQWEQLAAEGDGTVTVFPIHAEQPNTVEARRDFFDSIYHADVVAGVNTSAFIESTIVGRRVLAVPSPEFWIAQRGMAHFHYLLGTESGPVSAAESLDEHLRELDDALACGPSREEERRRFLETLVRPHGLDEPATPRVVTAVEELVGRRPPEAASAAGGLPARLALEALVGGLWLESRTVRLRRRACRRATRALGRSRRRAARALRRGRRRLRRSARTSLRRARRGVATATARLVGGRRPRAGGG